MKRQAGIKALPGDNVWARNYRCRPPQWEQGQVTHVETKWSREDYYTIYTILLDREGQSGNRIRLYCGDEQVEANHGSQV